MPKPDDSMEWVASFYNKQHQWGDVYSGDVEPRHRDRAKSIELPEQPSPYRVLELGCGGGQLAVALANLGHKVTAIDMNSEAIANARRLASAHPETQLTLIKGDFYSYAPTSRFDAICYFDGFGIGTDEDQRRLLHRVASWLAAGGRAFIEIYTPWYWKQVAGTQIEGPDLSRKYEFDAARSRMLDTWWPTDTPSDAVTQSLRCYSVNDLESLLDGTGLQLGDIQPGGCYNHETKVFHPSVSLDEAMQYVAVLIKQSQHL